MSPRRIVHLDLDAFFCSVEELKNPDLRGKPFMVGGRPEARGVVSSCSYAARAFGVSSAMPTSRALRLCPQLIIVRGNYRDYSDYSHQVMAIMGQYSGLLEQISVDEAYIDISDLPDDPVVFGKELQTEIFMKTALPCSLGIGSNKMIAKIATDVGKAAHHGTGSPMAIRFVPQGTEAEFLAPLPVRAMPGIGPKTAERLAHLGIRTLGELAREPEDNLNRVFGHYGLELAHRSRGLDDSLVSGDHETKSISQEVTFARDIDREKDLLDQLRSMSEQVGARMRKDHLIATTVKLKIRWPDFTTQSRQISLSQPFAEDSIIYQSAVQLFKQIWANGRPVRLIGIGVSGLQEGYRQLSLWETPTDKERRLLAAVDELKVRYGKAIVQRGRAIKPKQSADNED
ncbi:MAG TPA: DNA polymerase IV [Bellilinea sp.]|jgi:DNA polymerase-4|nr:DNA polymerase IV [Bellilinea sp.]